MVAVSRRTIDESRAGNPVRVECVCGSAGKPVRMKRADTSMVFTIAVIVFALSFVLAGRIQDKYGPLPCSSRARSW